ncbi:MAG: hypothetical protein D3924_06050 [Candidatus Electrothrix sp. AR4]|nr:hypothetical protein [Candidatus Electrothrix sp. AR4]
MKKIFLLFTAICIISGCAPVTPTQITNFEECVAAGNPVMESHPRQCRADDQTFIENLEQSSAE